MPPRRKRARTPSEAESDEDMSMAQDEEDELIEDDEEDEVLEDEDEDGDDEPDQLPQPRLKIKLKLGPTPHTASSTSAASTPGEEPLRPRRTTRAVNRVESEDESDPESDYIKNTSRMTARQARLHGAGESTELLSLNDEDGPYAKKKKILTETEVALRREETARKRKNLSEKKLEDEKAETINRLLKKQTRPRGRRPAVSNEDKQAEDDDEEGSAPPPPPPIPTMYRWVTTVRQPEGTEDSPQSSDRPMAMSFSVPYSAFSNVTPSSQEGELPLVDTTIPAPSPPQRRRNCDVNGCEGARKYRLVKDWNLGACSMPHLKQLELIS